MTEHHDDESHAQEAAHDEPSWTPPDTLTPPSAPASRPPVMALAAALGVAVACGVGLWVSSQFFYIYIFYNLLIGGALGWALSLAPKREGFTNVTALMVPGVLLAALPYLVKHVAFGVQYLGIIREEVPEAGFLDVMHWYLTTDTVFGIELGLLGSAALFLAEAGITIYAMYGRLTQGMFEARVASVPSDVIDFVVNGFASGWETDRVREELTRRGWQSREDQDRAIGTGFDVIAALRGAQAG